VLAQCNPFARIYHHTYEILSNHESSSINSEDIANNNGSSESESPYIIVSPSMKMCLIEGDDRRTHSLSTMEKVAAVISIEYRTEASVTSFLFYIIKKAGQYFQDSLFDNIMLSLKGYL
jgi:hypothetical protein